MQRSTHLWPPKTSLVHKFCCSLNLTPTDLDWSSSFFSPSQPFVYRGQLPDYIREAPREAANHQRETMIFKVICCGRQNNAPLKRVHILNLRNWIHYATWQRGMKVVHGFEVVNHMTLQRARSSWIFQMVLRYSQKSLNMEEGSRRQSLSECYNMRLDCNDFEDRIWEP